MLSKLLNKFDSKPKLYAYLISCMSKEYIRNIGQAS